ncbi:MAG: hypothetical protein AAF066_15595 [Pseudomonadota bacterium]
MRICLTDFLRMTLGLLLAMVLSFRVIAQPALLSAPEPGLFLICLNGQLVYISTETGQPVSKEPGEGATDCPFSGVTTFATCAHTISANQLDFSVVKELVWPQTGQRHLHNLRSYTARSPPA